MVSQRFGKELTFSIGPEDPDCRECLAVIKHLLQRDSRPLSQIPLEKINGRTALQSEYLACLRDEFDVYSDHKRVYLQSRV